MQQLPAAETAGKSVGREKRFNDLAQERKAHAARAALRDADGSLRPSA